MCVEGGMWVKGGMCVEGGMVFCVCVYVSRVWLLQEETELDGLGGKFHPESIILTWVQSLGQKDPLEKEMATHSSILAWRIPWAEEPGGLQSVGLQESDTTE